jgi:hypothetical protein
VRFGSPVKWESCGSMTIGEIRNPKANPLITCNLSTSGHPD